MNHPDIAVSGYGRRQAHPVLHASYGDRRTRYGRTHRALCGAAVYTKHGEPFPIEHPRACPACLTALSKESMA